MKNRSQLLFSVRIVLCFILLPHCYVVAQPEIPEGKVVDLAILCKTWGFLKYYHPNIRKGEVDWDKPLLQALDSLDKGKFELANALEFLVSCGGTYQVKGKPVDTTGFESMIDFTWLADQKTPFSVSSELAYLRDNLSKSKNHYALKTGGGAFYDVSFSNEILYDDSIIASDPNFQLLLLFRYWNIINYFWPNKHLLLEKWDSLLCYYIEKIKNATNEKEYHMNMRELSNSLNDAHAYYQGGGIPYYVYNRYQISLCVSKSGHVFIEDIPDNFLSGNRILMVGDEIITTERGTVVEISARIDSSARFCDRRQKDRLLVSELLRADSLTIRRKGETIPARIDPAIHKHREGKSTHAPALYNISKGIVYLDAASYMSGWDKIAYKWFGEGEMYLGNDLLTYYPNNNTKFDRHTVRLLRRTDTLLVDLRKYPSADFAYNFLRKVLVNGQKYVLTSKSITQKPGYFRDDLVLKFQSKSGKDRFKGLLVLLVSNNTASRGERTVYQLQTYSGEVVTAGTPTWGSAGSLVWFNLGNRIVAGFTHTCISENNRCIIEGQGVKLDHEISYEDQEGFEGGDFLLWKAIQVIRGK